jgi:hypothetical protein
LKKHWHWIYQGVLSYIPSHISSILYINTNDEKVYKLSPLSHDIYKHIIPVENTGFFVFCIWFNSKRKYEYVIIESSILRSFTRTNIKDILTYVNTYSRRNIFSVCVINELTARVLDNYKLSYGLPNNVTTEAVVLLNRFLTNNTNCDTPLKDVEIEVYDDKIEPMKRRYGEFITRYSRVDELD